MQAEAQAPVGVEEPTVAEAELEAPVGVEEPAAVAAEPQAAVGVDEPAAVEATEADKPRARHRMRPRTTVKRFLRRVTITMGAAALVALVWYFASSAVVFSRPSPLDGQQPAGAEQLDDRVIVRKTHVPAATLRMGGCGANAPITQAVGGVQPASASRAPSGGASGASPSQRSSPMPTPTPMRPRD